MKRLTLHGLTKSQWRAVGAILVGAVWQIAQNAVDIRRWIDSLGLPPKVVHALYGVISLCLIIYAAMQRSLNSKRAGTNTGLVDSGPDPLAAEAQATSPPPAPAGRHSGAAGRQQRHF